MRNHINKSRPRGRDQSGVMRHGCPLALIRHHDDHLPATVSAGGASNSAKPITVSPAPQKAGRRAGRTNAGAPGGDTSGDIGPVIFDGTPEAGLGGIIGKIENAQVLWPDRPVFIYLAQFYGDQEGEGAFLLEPSIFPKAQLGSGGRFQAMNLPPMSYVLILGPNAESGLIIKENGRTAIYEVSEKYYNIL